MIVLKYLIALLLLCYAVKSDQKASEIRDTNPADKDAKDIYVSIGGILYYITTGDGCYRNFGEATQFCNDQGMGLAAFETLQENNDVADYIYTNGYYNFFWTSGKYIDGVMLWTSTGEIVTYDNWGPYPSCNESTCGIGLVIRPDYPSPNSWYPHDTGYNYCPICEEFH